MRFDEILRRGREAAGQPAEEIPVDSKDEDESDEEGGFEDRDPSGEAGEVILGKEIAEDWRKAALREIEEDDKGQEGGALK